MGRRRHKRKNSHVVIVTSDAVDVSTKQFRIRFWFTRTVGMIFWIAVGAVAGYFIYERDVSKPEDDAVAVVQDEARIAELETENALLLGQIDELNSSVQILSETVTQKTESERQLADQIAQQYLPTVYPLTGHTGEETPPEGDPMCVFTGTAGAMVVASASGTVYAVVDDTEYGHNVWIDHGNGYMTIYRNKGEVKVRQGDTVTQGSTIYLIGEDNKVLGFQMMKDEAYIDPMEMLVVNG